MKQNLEVLKHQIDIMDQSPEYALVWFNSNSRQDLFLPMIGQNILAVSKPHNQSEYNEYEQNFWMFLNQRYHKHTWPCHDVHFHTNFAQYIYCPFTCLNEISECLEKIIKEYFCA